MKLHRSILIIAILSQAALGTLTGKSAMRALQWHRTLAEFQCLPGDSQIATTFEFTNRGRQSVEILSIHPACGCTSAALEKRSFAPGETGALVLVFNTADRVGPQDSETVVYVSDRPEEPVRLRLRTAVPEWMLTSHQSLAWEKGEAPSERFLDVRLADPQRTEFEALAVSSPRLKLRVEWNENKSVARIHIFPTSTSTEWSAALQVHVRSKVVTDAVVMRSTVVDLTCR